MHLDIDHSTLSQLLRGKRPLTERAVARLGERLGLDRTAIGRYAAYQRVIGIADAPRCREAQQLTRETAKLITDWYHFAILELVRIQVLHIFQNVGENGEPIGPVRVRLAVEPDAIPAQNP